MKRLRCFCPWAKAARAKARRLSKVKLNDRMARIRLLGPAMPADSIFRHSWDARLAAVIAGTEWPLPRHSDAQLDAIVDKLRRS